MRFYLPGGPLQPELDGSLLLQRQLCDMAEDKVHRDRQHEENEEPV